MRHVAALRAATGLAGSARQADSGGLAPLVSEDDWTTQKRPISSIPRLHPGRDSEGDDVTLQTPMEGPGGIFAGQEASMGESEATLVLSAAEQSLLVARAKAGREPPDLPPAAPPAEAPTTPPPARLRARPDEESPAFPPVAEVESPPAAPADGAEPPSELEAPRVPGAWVLMLLAAAAGVGFAVAEAVRSSPGDSPQETVSEPQSTDAPR